MILINAAFSLEHLSKAYLYAQHPALLMEVRNGQFDSLLHLTGLGGKARKLKAPRTISAKEALARVEQLMTLRTPRAALDELIDVRDGVVHVGYLSQTSTREILTVFLRFSNELYEEQGVDESARWGDHSTLVTSLITQALSEIEHEVQRKIAAAKRRIGELMSKIPESEHVAVGDARQAMTPFQRYLDQEASASGSRDHRITIRCPACNHPDASCIGHIEWDFDMPAEIGSMDRIEEVAGQEEYFLPRALLCGSCDLRLDSEDELQAVGIPRRVVFGGRGLQLQ
ncbi:hypothetical protein BKM31_15985 [[Actinomadura] parvosata subsp. kistnae]|uniref:Uncharacterized protein n=1 Tax=[Actinomadura] parvosata subsp. kistnae TaxID=1909395 RepID=A0A1U9ZXW9_9ACTN|nr:hypothetical protein BKM31_15985 [Nonomuraea sp. ATCC 55076]